MVSFDSDETIGASSPDQNFITDAGIDYKKDKIVWLKHLGGFQITPANGDYKSIMKIRWMLSELWASKVK